MGTEQKTDPRPPQRWWAIADLPLPSRVKLAGDSTQWQMVLQELAHCAEPEVLAQLLDNPKCPPDAVTLIVDRADSSYLFEQQVYPDVSISTPLSMAEQLAAHPNLDQAGMRKLAQWAVKSLPRR